MNTHNSHINHSQARVDREKIQQIDSQFFAAVSNALFQHDPIKINFQINTDEYDPEAGTVIPRLENCSSVYDVVTVLHEEFVLWFGSGVAGERSRYVGAAKDIWNLFQQQRTT